MTNSVVITNSSFFEQQLELEGNLEGGVRNGHLFTIGNKFIEFLRQIWSGLLF